MKIRIITATLAVAAITLYINATNAQNPGYVHYSLMQCRNDTLKYLRNMAYDTIGFNGRPVSEVVNMLELPVKGVQYYLMPRTKADLGCIEFILEDVAQYQYKVQTRMPRIEFKLFVKDQIANKFVTAEEVKSKFGGVGEMVIVPYTGTLRQWIEQRLRLVNPGGMQAYRVP